MKRLFGLSGPSTPAQPAKPPPSLQDGIKNVEARGSTIDERIKGLDAELVKYKEQIKKTRPGPAQNAIKQRAMRVLQQKKNYERQRDQLYQQQFSMDQIHFATETMKDTVTTVEAMKVAAKEMKTVQKNINIDQIEDMHDDLDDMLMMNDEIQEVLGRSYGVPDDLDDADLEAELAGLEEEMASELTTEAAPSYMQAREPQLPTAPTHSAFTLPDVPQRVALQQRN
eukprot:gnl/Hemi2/18662_TR6181_c0_g1_i1.p1 gnl/Hemi2/18662_TR6181_c0_g1~~gnl/Hemi2/18662_TR6181_c0_g1_i1.p1  ORF type:complete len:226 (-),score=88.76 gnl/Hemi2/18662_TR6181_c0_g1_i1:189-866(-)